MKSKKQSGSSELVIFETGDLVRDRINPKRKGKIVRAGPQQSEVKWRRGGPSNSGGVSVEVNKYLKKLKRKIS